LPLTIVSQAGASACDKQGAVRFSYGLTWHRVSYGPGERPEPVAMPQYYFVLSSRDGFVEDTEGTELPDLVTARQEAAKGVTHLRQPRIGGRRSWAGWAMQVRDEGGAVLFEVPDDSRTMLHRSNAESALWKGRRSPGVVSGQSRGAAAGGAAQGLGGGQYSAPPGGTQAGARTCENRCRKRADRTGLTRCSHL